MAPMITVKAISGEVIFTTGAGSDINSVNHLKAAVGNAQVSRGSKFGGLQLLSGSKTLDDRQLLTDLDGWADGDIVLTAVCLAEPEPVTEEEVNQELKRKEGQFNAEFRPNSGVYSEEKWQIYLATRVSRDDRNKMRRQLEELREIKWRVRKVYGIPSMDKIDQAIFANSHPQELQFQEFVYGDSSVGYDPKDVATFGEYAHMSHAARYFEIPGQDAESMKQACDERSLEAFNAEKERVRQDGLLREGPIDAYRFQTLPAC